MRSILRLRGFANLPVFPAQFVPSGCRWAQDYDAPTMATTDVVTVDRTIPAPAEAIFELLADPSRHSDIDGSGTVRVDDTIWRVAGPDAPAGSRVKVVQADGANLTVAAA